LNEENTDESAKSEIGKAVEVQSVVVEGTTTTTITEIKLPGYYINQGKMGSFIQCSVEECKLYTKDLGKTECDESTIGELYYKTISIDNNSGYFKPELCSRIKAVGSNPGYYYFGIGFKGEETPSALPEEQTTRKRTDKETTTTTTAETKIEENDWYLIEHVPKSELTEMEERAGEELKDEAEAKNGVLEDEEEEQNEEEQNEEQNEEEQKEEEQKEEEELGNIFNFDRSAKYYVLKVKEKSITFDPTAEFTDQGALTSGQVVDRKTDFCDSNSSGKYFTCIRGKCTSKDQNNYDNDKSDEDVGEKTECTFKIETTTSTDGKTTTTSCTPSNCEAVNDGYHLVEINKEEGESKSRRENEESKLVLYTHDAEEEPKCVVVENDDIKLGYFRNSYQYNGVIECDSDKKCEKAKLVEECKSDTHAIVDNAYSVGLCDGGNIIPFKDDEKEKVIKTAPETKLVFSESNKSYRLTTSGNSITGIIKATYSFTEDSSGKVRFTSTNSVPGELFIDMAGEIIIENEKVLSNRSKVGYLVNIDESDACTVITQPYTDPGYYIIVKNSKYLINCNGGKCEINEVNYSDTKYYLNASTSTKSENPLIKCYKDTSTNNSECVLVEKGSAKGYYKDAASSQAGLISCTAGGSCQSVKGENRYAYISEDPTKLFLIKGNKIETIGVSDDDDKAYLNGGSDKNDNPIIMKVEVKSEEDTEGESRKRTSPEYIWQSIEVKNANSIFINGNVGSDDKTKAAVILCVSPSTCKEVDATSENSIFIDVGGQRIIMMDLNSYSKRTQPVNVKKEWTAELFTEIENLVNGKAFYVSENLVVKINNSGKNGKIVYCDTKIVSDSVKNGITETTECNLLEDNYENYYVNAYDGGLIQVESSSPKLVDNSEIEDGYYINSIGNGGDTPPDVVKCIKEDNEYLGLYPKCEKLTFGTSGDDSCGVGAIITSKGKFCNNDEGSGESFPSSITKYILSGKKLYDDNNNNNNNYLFNVSSKVITKVTLEKEKYYLVKDGKVLTGAEIVGDKIYKCDSTKCSEENLSNEKYYSNDDYETAYDYPIIHCKKDENDSVQCTYESENERNNYCEKDNKLNKCKNDCTDCVEITPKVGKYLNEAEGKMIICENKVNKVECKMESEDNSNPNTEKNVGFSFGEDVIHPLIKSFISVGIKKYKYFNKFNGYYIEQKQTDIEVIRLIKCKNSNNCKYITVGPTGTSVQPGSIGKRSDVLVNLIFYKGGDDEEGPILRCAGTSDNYNCEAVAEPKDGYYVNESGKSKSGSFLLNCSETGCSEYNPDIEGGNTKYFKNGASNLDKKGLIKCSNEGCQSIQVTNSGYYINGANNQLIYCIDNSCDEIPVSQNGWYVKNGGKELIKCKFVYGVMNCGEVDGVEGGYYVNSDQFTLSYQPLIHQDTTQVWATQGSEAIGWYLNADGEAADAELIISCKSKYACEYKEAKSGECSMSNAGEFIKNSQGEVRWCNDKGVGIELKDNGGNILSTLAKSDIVGAGSNNNYGLLEIGKN